MIVTCFTLEIYRSKHSIFQLVTLIPIVLLGAANLLEIITGIYFLKKLFHSRITFQVYSSLISTVFHGIAHSFL
jgi:hypothetical protein